MERKKHMRKQEAKIKGHMPTDFGAGLHGGKCSAGVLTVRTNLRIVVPITLNLPAPPLSRRVSPRTRSPTLATPPPPSCV